VNVQHDVPSVFPLASPTWQIFAEGNRARFGWYRDGRNEPVTFVVSTVSLFSGVSKTVATFPLTEAGWQLAWAYMGSSRPQLAERVRERLASRPPSMNAEPSADQQAPRQFDELAADNSSVIFNAFILLGIVAAGIGGAIAGAQAPGTGSFGNPTGSNGGFIAGLVIASLGGTAVWFGLIGAAARLATRPLRASLEQLQRVVTDLTAATHLTDTPTPTDGWGNRASQSRGPF
jgi:hypothetical protein